MSPLCFVFLLSLSVPRLVGNTHNLDSPSLQASLPDCTPVAPVWGAMSCTPARLIHFLPPKFLEYPSLLTCPLVQCFLALGLWLFLLFPPSESVLRSLPSGFLFVLSILCLVAQSCPTLCYPMDSSPPGSSIHGDSPARILEWVAVPSCRASSQPRDRTQVSHIAWQILYCLSHQGSPRVLEWVTLSLLQGNFQSQESNRCLLHCRWILYQLSYLGSPFYITSL